MVQDTHNNFICYGGIMYIFQWSYYDNQKHTELETDEKYIFNNLSSKMPFIELMWP